MKKKNITRIVAFFGVCIVIVAIGQALGIIKPEKKADPEPTQEIVATEKPIQESIFSTDPTIEPIETVEATKEPKSTIEITKEPEPIKGEEITFDVDWESCIADLKEELTNPEIFFYVKDLGVFINEEEKKITFTASLGDATDPIVALDFADTFIRRLNAISMLQDSSIAGGSKDYYGGLYDTYSILIGIAPMSKTDDDSQWFVYDAVAKGAHTKIKLQKKYR